MAVSSRILVICDDRATSMYLREKLVIDGDCVVSFESTSPGGISALKQESFDIVIAKFGMPDLEGIRLIKELKKIDSDSIIIVLINEASPTLLKEIHQLGIYDFITTPINFEKLFFLIKKGVELHSLNVAHRKLFQSLQEHNISLQKQNTLLAKRIEESTRNLARLYEDLRNTYMRTIKVLAQTIDARDHYTHSHSENVARIAVAIAEEMGFSVKDTELIREACELHDLGKIGVQDSILGKPSELTEQEWEQIKRHPLIGAEILEPLTFLNGVTELVRQHHEHYDGLGYPDGRKGEEILLGARIIHLADAYESMRSERSYRREPLSKEDAILELKNKSGAQFDPKVVEAFLKIVDKL